MKNKYGAELDRNGYAPSIMHGGNECYICGRTGILQRHEIFGAANRDKSKEYGLWVALCPECHNNLHFRNAEVKKWLRVRGQLQAMFTYLWNKDDFRELFGKNYI